MTSPGGAGAADGGPLGPAAVVVTTTAPNLNLLTVIERTAARFAARSAGCSRGPTFNARSVGEVSDDDGCELRPQEVEPAPERTEPTPRFAIC